MTDTSSRPVSAEPESLSDELARLVREYDTGERQNRADAWNLIAEFAVENCPQICAALKGGGK